MSVVSTPAVLPRSFNYSETSRVLRLYTKDLGLVSVMAKGVRRSGARGQSGLDTFSRGELTAYVRPTRDLQTFKEFAVEEAGGSLGRDVLRFAGASVLAKCVRDHLMQLLDRRYPKFGWGGNKGYGTAEHLTMLDDLGPTPHHRRSFGPVIQPRLF